MFMSKHFHRRRMLCSGMFLLRNLEIFLLLCTRKLAATLRPLELVGGCPPNYTEYATNQLLAGPPRAGSPPPHNEGGPAENLDTGWERLTSQLQRRGVDLKGFSCAIDNDTIEKGKNICNTVGPRATAIPATCKNTPVTSSIHGSRAS
jgi:hypothetical protein